MCVCVCVCACVRVCVCVTVAIAHWLAITHTCAQAFATQCTYYSTQFLVKAMEVCKIDRCGTRCPHHLDDDCDVGLHCAVQADGYWSQCVDCNATTYKASCKYWSPKIRAAADKVCHEQCPTA